MAAAGDAPLVDARHIIMEGVEELNECYPVRLVRVGDLECIDAYNQGGYDSVQIPLAQVIAWAKAHRPELLK